MAQTILIVDDNPNNLRPLAEMLIEQGYKVRPAINGSRALATVWKELPDLILLDIMMPDINGYEVCRRLKADERTQDIPVIFISALDSVFDKTQAFAVGGVDYITKPLQIEEVLARVQTHLALKEMRQHLEIKNKQLQQQNQELDAFAHTVAHDLKNPLSIITGYTGVLRYDADDMSKEELKKVGQATYEAAKKAASIIESLLLLGSVRKEAVRLTPLNMAKIVEQVQERLKANIVEYQAEINLPQTWPLVLGYAPWVEEVWINYMSNALKYGGRPPHLTLGGSPQTDGMVRFWVQDNGRGLDKEAQSTLFAEFTRLNQVRVEGHGLGLSIVRRIVDKLGGDVGVESQPGQGSTFYFTLQSAEES